MKRQPNGVRPNIHSPRAITHLPVGGCATKDPVSESGITRGSASICGSTILRSGQVLS